jgi:hypothetical protein
MPFGYIFPGAALYLPFVKFAYDQRSQDEADNKGRKDGKNSTEGDVPEYIQG